VLTRADADMKERDPVSLGPALSYCLALIAIDLR
jgi:hypothetical protein